MHAPLADCRRIQYNVGWFYKQIFTLIWKAVQIAHGRTIPQRASEDGPPMAA